MAAMSIPSLEPAAKRYAIYARFSSALQRDASIEDQVRRCTEYIEQRGGQIRPDLLFTDMAISGSSLARPGFEKLLEAVNAKRVDVIVTEDISRISRDFADAATVFRQLQFQGVQLIGIADGVDTASRNAKLPFFVKALVGELYLDDLRDKTLRGLEGRARAGYATGGLPFGYRSEAAVDGAGRTVGHNVIIDETHAEIVRRVFELYLQGNSLAGIAKLLTRERVPPPRANTKLRRKGWIPGTIRGFLSNRAYIGEWTFKRNQWCKVPGSNARRPRRRSDAEILRQKYPERRIIEQQIFDAVQRRLGEIRACYAKGGNGQSGRRTTYPFSGILHCGECGAPMVIFSGSHQRYYRCSANAKRGTCANKLSVREDVVRAGVLGELRRRLTSPEAVAYLARRVEAELRTTSATISAELVRRKARLSELEVKLANLVEFVAGGDGSTAVRDALKRTEAEAEAERTAIAELAGQARPRRVPDVDAVVQHALDVETMVARDPTRAREALRNYFANGRIDLKPQIEGHYVAESRLFPLVPLVKAHGPGGNGPCATAIGCAGWI